MRGYWPSVSQGGARLVGRPGAKGGCVCLEAVEAVRCGRDTGVAAGSGGCGRRCGRGEEEADPLQMG